MGESCWQIWYIGASGEQETFKHGGFGLALNASTIDVDVDDGDLFWKLESVINQVIAFFKLTSVR